MSKIRESYEVHIRRVLKEVKPEASIAKDAIEYISLLLNNLRENIIDELSHLARLRGVKTVREPEMQTAIKLYFPSELEKRARKTGLEASEKFRLNKNEV